MKKAKPEQTLDLLEVKVNAGFAEGRKRYRMKSIDDLYLTARYKAQFSSSHLEGIDFVPRDQVTLTPESEKWMTKKIKATVQLGSLRLEKVSISPEMAMRINPAAHAIALASS